ncbi:MAG: rhomboid family intramembrane serine protease, partial [Alphaproteobacteria bacterium]|nr:rhomboid family intramembrane serine protease [Alphaproteobacteria bacterium]
LARVWLLPAPLAEQVLTNFGFVPLRYAPNALQPGSLVDRAIPFVSYIFLHADAMHLTVNCLWLLAFGPAVARRYGTWAFLLFFFVCGIAAAAVHLALDWRAAGVIIGASGAISGLMAAGIRTLRPPQQAPSAALVPILSPQVLAFTALWVAINLAAGFVGVDIFGAGHEIAWQAHLGGYFTGLLLCGPFDRLVGLETAPADPT